MNRKVSRVGTLGLLLTALASPHATWSQSRPGALSRADSALVGRILLAENRRDSTDASLTEGLKSLDPRIQTIAKRARWRITDPKFAARDSLPPLPAPPTWPEPAWRLRYRALGNKQSDCQVLRIALADSAWPVRLRAVDLVSTACASDDSLMSVLRKWVDALPQEASRRSAGGVTWHAAAHALVALARTRPDDARPRLAKLATHGQWQVRMYAARAAAVLADTARLRRLAVDGDDNVKQAAIEALAKLTGHADDDLYLEALRSRGAQAVRAAALALVGSPRPDVRLAANTAFDRWVARHVASARDARVALLQAAGRPESDDRPPPFRPDLAPQAVALALGKEVYLRVAMSPASGGGSFVIRLRGDIAPIMAARVLELVSRGYYNGLTWQRVEPDFVIQGGSPGASEYVGLADYIRDELGNVPHVRGTIGMSTRGHDTGDGQWFVNLRDNQRLDRDYTVFGEVVKGIEVVDGVLEGDAMAAITVVGPPAGADRRWPDRR